MKISALHTAAAVSLAAMLTLSGCSLLPRITNIGGDGSSSGGSSDSGGSNGSDDVEDNPFLDHDVPADFPADVPLPDLDVYLALSTTADSWSIIYRADDLVADYNAIVDQYEAAGWEVLMNNSADDSALGVFKKEPYQVQVLGVTDESSDFDGPGISFTVVRS